MPLNFQAAFEALFKDATAEDIQQEAPVAEETPVVEEAVKVEESPKAVEKPVEAPVQEAQPVRAVRPPAPQQQVPADPLSNFSNWSNERVIEALNKGEVQGYLNNLRWDG